MPALLLVSSLAIWLALAFVSQVYALAFPFDFQIYVRLVFVSQIYTRLPIGIADTYTLA